MRIGSFLYGSILGALVGAAVALIMAPSSGEDLRNQMQDRYKNIQNEMKTAAENRRIELEQQLAAMRAPKES